MDPDSKGLSPGMKARYWKWALVALIILFVVGAALGLPGVIADYQVRACEERLVRSLIGEAQVALLARRGPLALALEEGITRKCREWYGR